MGLKGASGGGAEGLSGLGRGGGRGRLGGSIIEDIDLVLGNKTGLVPVNKSGLVLDDETGGKEEDSELTRISEGE